MDYPGKDLIEAIDKAINDSADSIENALQDVSTELLEAITEFLATLEKNRLGTIKASVVNLKAITRFKQQLTTLMQNGEYAALAANINSDFLTVTSLTNQYFSVVADGFKPTDFYKEIRRQNVSTTLETLTGSGMESQFIAPITKVLQQSVTGQMTSKQALSTVKEMLSDAGQPTRWAKTYTDDALNQYSRLYTQAISDDFDLQHFLYSGTQIDATRPFCQSKVGKVFTKAEVTAWASQQWSGKNPATNAGNIEILLGGYRCRHALRPISKQTYDELKKG